MFLFLLINSVANRSLLDQFTVFMPVVFHRLFVGALGFFVGFFAANFIFFVITITPLSKMDHVNRYTSLDTLSDTAKEPVILACDIVNGVSMQWAGGSCRDVVEWYYQPKEKPIETEKAAPPESDPVKPN